MKKITIVLLVLITIGFFWATNKSSEKNNKPQTQNPTPNLQTQNHYNQVELNLNNQKYIANWTEIDNVQKINLSPNFDEQIDASAFQEKENCELLTNAGFYTTDNKPLGLFISNGQIKRNKIQSELVNGYFTVINNSAKIESSLDESQNLILALQTGPIIYKDNKEQLLNILNDKTARRVALGITNDNKVVFLTLYRNESLFDGPNLSDMPRLITMFSNKTGVNFKDVINLDGGSASVYITDGVHLNELTHVGAFFCIK